MTDRELMKQAFEALEDMMEEFRGYDLPYGSKAYAKAKDARLGLWKCLSESCKDWHSEYIKAAVLQNQTIDKLKRHEQSEREAWRYADELEQERKQLQDMLNAERIKSKSQIAKEIEETNDEIIKQLHEIIQTLSDQIDDLEYKVEHLDGIIDMQAVVQLSLDKSKRAIESENADLKQALVTLESVVEERNRLEAGCERQKKLLHTQSERIAQLESELSETDRLIRASVPEPHNVCTSPVSAAQNYIAALEKSNKEWNEKTKWVQQTSKPSELGMHRADVLKARIFELEAAIKRTVEAEREACARIADRYHIPMCDTSADAIAWEIRVRSNT